MPGSTQHRPGWPERWGHVPEPSETHPIALTPATDLHSADAQTCIGPTLPGIGGQSVGPQTTCTGARGSASLKALPLKSVSATLMPNRVQVRCLN